MRLSVLAALAGSVEAATKAQAPNGVQKVIDLLESMRKTLAEEAKDDDKRYAKMECWCRHSTEEQTAIKEKAEKELGDTKALIDQKTGEIAKMTEENKGMTADIAKSEKELATAKKNREKEAGQAAKEQQEMNETLAALSKALEILGKLHGKSLVDASTATSLLQVMSSTSHFRDTLQKDLFDVLGEISQGQSVTKFLQKDFSKGPVMPEGAKAAETKAYNSQSGAIFGLLSEMESQFQRDLKQSQDDEAAAIENFKKLTAAKLGEIATLKEQIAANKEAIGQAKMDLSNATKDNKEAARNYQNSTEMLAEISQTCTDATKGHDERVKARGEEMNAVAEALKVLTGDEARSLFNKTTFVQLQASSTKAINAQRQRAAVSALLEAARKTGDVRMSALAVSTGLDNFTEVKQMISNLVAELTQQKKDEFAHRDECNEAITTYESDYRTEEINKEDADAQVELMETKAANLTKELEELASATKKAEESMAEATAQRTEDNKGFQVAKKDQELTIQVLDKALAKLAPVYGASLALAQQPKQATYEKSNAGPSVMGLLETIKADSQHAIDIMVSDEQKAQSEYEKLVESLNGEIKNMAEATAQKTGEKADSIAAKATAQEASDSAGEAMMNIDKALVVKHKECDFLLKNFQVRQDAFSAEIDSCNQAIAILSGANFGF
jgi:hypothetical protein